MKYISADKLIAEIKIIQQSLENRDVYGNQVKKIRTECMIEFCKCIFDAIDSLQQEREEVQDGRFVFPKYLYARTKDNKTIDMSYAPQDMTAVEYIRNDSIEQEQPTKGYDEKYLNEKIAKAKKSWEGVDVDKYMDDVRGREQQEQPEVDLEKEIEEQINMYYNECEKKLNQMSDDDTDIGFLTLNNFARHFYELGFYAGKV